LRVLLADAAPCGLALSGAAWPLMGAVGGTGGWFESAPGTPPAVAGPGVELSLVDYERIAALSADWYGPYFSSTFSTDAKSTSAVTCARTLPGPTIGSRMSSMRLIVLASICPT